MGSGSYSYMAARGRSVERKDMARSMGASAFREETFKQRQIDPDMVIKGKVRESRDSDEHPESFPIIIALDTTGSMGHIPQNLITGAFPEIMKNILEAGVADPQVCFIGVGDCYCDNAPIQCGQFESSDELMEKWFQKVYLEGGGGSNPGESYNLTWYFAARHTSTDAWEKRKKKGVVITIGDEACLAEIPASNIKNLFGDPAQSGATSRELLAEVKECWEPYHIHIGTGTSYYDTAIMKWKDLIGEDRLEVLPRENYPVVATITGLVLKAYGKPADTVATTAADDPKIML